MKYILLSESASGGGAGLFVELMNDESDQAARYGSRCRADQSRHRASLIGGESYRATRSGTEPRSEQYTVAGRGTSRETKG